MYSKRQVSSASLKSESGESAPTYVGFANLPNQVHRKSVKKGFEFTLMVVGKYQKSVSIHACSFHLADYTITFEVGFPSNTITRIGW